MGSVAVIVFVIAGAYKWVPVAAPAILGVGISLVVVVFTFIALFTGVFGERTADRVIDLVRKGRSADSESGPDTPAE